MSDEKISQLPPLTDPTLDDLLAIVNASTTKQITLRDLFKSFTDTNGLAVNFFLVPAGERAPDGEYYYKIQTDPLMPINEGELINTTPMSECQDSKSRTRIDHAASLPSLGWHSIQVSDMEIHGICFLDHANGFAVTQDGKIFKTTDCGRSWVLKYSNSTGDPILAIIVTPVGGRGQTLHAVSGTTLYYSTDLGDTWTLIDLNVAELKTNERFFSISGTYASLYSDSKKAVVELGAIYALGDMGTVVQVKFDIDLSYSVSYYSSLPGDSGYKKIYAFGRGFEEGVILYAAGTPSVNNIVKGRVYINSDGQTWQELLALDNTDFNGLYFTDSTQGWVAGGNTSTQDSVIYHTDDSGQNWANVSPATIGALYDIVSDPNSGVVWAVGTNGIIVTSSDNGATWVQDVQFTTDIGRDGMGLLAVSTIINGRAYVAGDLKSTGMFYYKIPNRVNNVYFNYTPVDTLWVKITLANKAIKEGFVAALDVITK